MPRSRSWSTPRSPALATSSSMPPCPVTNGGVWRSLDTGKTWQNMMPATPRTFSWTKTPPSSPASIARACPSAAISSESTPAWRRPPTPAARYLYQHEPRPVLGSDDGNGRRSAHPGPQRLPSTRSTVNDPSSTPNGAKGRIVLAAPRAHQGRRAEPRLRRLALRRRRHAQRRPGWPVLTKDFGQNWTKVRLPVVPTLPASLWSVSADQRSEPHRQDLRRHTPGLLQRSARRQLRHVAGGRSQQPQRRLPRRHGRQQNHQHRPDAHRHHQPVRPPRRFGVRVDSE